MPTSGGACAQSCSGTGDAGLSIAQKLIAPGLAAENGVEDRLRGAQLPVGAQPRPDVEHALNATYFVQRGFESLEARYKKRYLVTAPAQLALKLG